MDVKYCTLHTQCPPISISVSQVMHSEKGSPKNVIHSVRALLTMRPMQWIDKNRFSAEFPASFSRAFSFWLQVSRSIAHKESGTERNEWGRAVGKRHTALTRAKAVFDWPISLFAFSLWLHACTKPVWCMRMCTCKTAVLGQHLLHPRPIR